jgi:hypothetical protein
MGAEAAAFTWPFCVIFCGDFSAEIFVPVARGLVFCGFEAPRRALEMTKRRRSGAGFTPALRRLLLRCLRATLPRAVFFLFDINNNRPAAAHLVQKKPQMLSAKRTTPARHINAHSPIKLQESANTRRPTRLHVSPFWPKLKKKSPSEQTFNTLKIKYL